MKKFFLICAMALVFGAVAVSCSKSDPLPELNVSAPDAVISYEGADVVVSVTSNYAWSCVVPSGVKVSPSQGVAFDKPTDVVITIPANISDADVEYSVEFLCVNGTESANYTVKIKQTKPDFVNVDGRDYAIKFMADGNIWMTENLACLPGGAKPSADATVNSEVWYPNAATAAALTSDADVKKYGYLYRADYAFGEKITAENAGSFEGVDGICPLGWHIPTAAEAQALLDKFWDADKQKGAPLADLEKAGFNPVGGGFRMQNTSVTAGKYATMPGYFLTSTLNKYDVNATTGAITAQYKAMMITDNASYQRITLANTSAFGGCNVRCVRDK